MPCQVCSPLAAPPLCHTLQRSHALPPLLCTPRTRRVALIHAPARPLLPRTGMRVQRFPAPFGTNAAGCAPLGAPARCWGQLRGRPHKSHTARSDPARARATRPATWRQPS